MNDHNVARLPAHYNFDVAQWIAEQHAQGDSLQALHVAHKDIVPAPLIISRWRREFPAFDMVMTEAEKSRAAVLAEDVLTVAENTRLPAAKTANRMKARQWLAERLDPARFGNQYHAPRLPDPGNGKRVSLAQFSDDDLQEIIRAHLQDVSIDGEATAAAAPGSPPQGKTPGLEAKDGKDTPLPNTFLKELPVTYNEAPVASHSEPDF